METIKFFGKVIFLNIIPLFLYLILLVLIGRLINLDDVYYLGIVTGIIIGIVTIIITGILTGILTGIFIGLITGQSSNSGFLFDSFFSGYKFDLLIIFMVLILLLSIGYNNYKIRYSAKNKIRKRYLYILIAVHNGVYLFCFWYIFAEWLGPMMPGF